MAETKLDGVAEGNATTASQSAYSLENNSYFKDKATADLSAYDSNITSTAKEDTLSYNPEWQKYIADKDRFTKTDNPSYKQIERMFADRRMAKIVEANARDLHKFDTYIKDYNDMSKLNFWDRMVMGNKASWYQLRMLDKTNKLETLKHDGASEYEIQQAQDELQKAQFDYENNSQEFDSQFWNTGSQIASGTVRILPELIATTVASGVASTATAGTASAIGMARIANVVTKYVDAAEKFRVARAGLKAVKAGTKAAKAARVAGNITGAVGGFASVYGDTYKVEAGALYQDLNEKYPEMTDNQKHELVSQTASLIAITEAAPSLFGIGITGRLSKVGKDALVDAVVKSKIPDNILKSAQFVQALNKEASKYTAKGIVKNAAKELGKDIAVEPSTETWQDMLHNAAVKVAGGEEQFVIDGALTDLGNFLADPTSEKNKDYLDTFLSVAAVTPLFSAPTIAYQSARGTVNMKNPMVKMNQTLAQVQLADNINKFYKEAGVAKESKEAVKEFEKGLVESGDLPSKVFFDKEALTKTLESDPEFNEAMNQVAGLKEAIEDSNSNGGTVSVSLEEAASSIFSNDKLYSKVRGMISMDASVQTMSQFNKYIEKIEFENKREIKEAVEDANSVYNRVLEVLATQEGLTDAQRKSNAAIFQMVANRIVSMNRDERLSAREWYDRNVEIRTNVATEAPQTTPQATPQVTPQATPQATPQVKETVVSDNVPTLTLDQMFHSPHEKWEVAISETNGRHIVWDGSVWRNTDSLEEARTIAEEGKADDIRKKEEDVARNERIAARAKKTKEDFINGNGTFSIDVIIDWLQKSNMWDGIAIRTKGNINNIEEITIKDGEPVSFVPKNRKALKPSVSTAAQNLIKSLRQYMIESETGDASSVAREWYDRNVEIRTNVATEAPQTTPQATPQVTPQATPQVKDVAVKKPKSKKSSAETRMKAAQDFIKKNWYGEKIVFEPIKDIDSVKTFTSDGKLKKAVWNKIRELFSEEKLNEESGGRTFEERLYDTVKNKSGLTRSVSDAMINGAAKEAGIEPLQLENALRLARGEEVVAEEITPTTEVLEEQAKETIAEVTTEQDKAEVFENVFLSESAARNFVNEHPGETAYYFGPGNELTEVDVQPKLKQETKGGITAGWFEKTSDKYIISLTDKANPTTFAHETFHLYSRAVQDLYNSGRMTPFWERQAEKFFEVAEAQPQVDPADQTVVRYFLTETQEEAMAERFTSYLLKNELPNQELSSMFALMKSAFIETYRTLQMTAYKVDKKAAEVFDVISQSQAAVEREQQALGVIPIEQPENIEREFYDRYVAFLIDSSDKATNQDRKLYYAIKKYKESDAYRTKYDATKTAVAATIEREPIYQIKALAKELKTRDVITLLEAYNKSKPEEEQVGLDEVTDALNAKDTMEERAIAQTEEIMKQHLNERYKTDVDALAQKFVRNRSLAKALLSEAMMYEGKAWQEFELEYGLLLDGVKKQMSKMKLSHLLNDSYWAKLEDACVGQYQVAMFAKDLEAAAKARRNQAQITIIREKAKEMKNRIDRFDESFTTKMASEQKKIKGKYKYDAETYDLLQSILEAYGFKINNKRRGKEPVHVKLDNWLKRMEESMFCPISNIRAFVPDLTAKNHHGNIKEMTMREFEVMDTLMKSVSSFGADEFRIEGELAEEQKIKMINDTIERLNAKGIKRFDKTNAFWNELGLISRIANPEPILKALFPEEVMLKVFYPLFTAAAKADNVTNQWTTAWKQLKRSVKLSSDKRTFSNGVTLQYYQIADLLLAMGSEHAYQNWLLYLGISDEQAQQVMSEALAEQPKLAEFAQATWALYDKSTDLLNESYRKRTNKIFVKKDPRGFTINGIKFKGGYVPENKNMPVLPTDQRFSSLVMMEMGNEKLINDVPDGKGLASIVDNTGTKLALYARWGYCADVYNNAVRFMEDSKLQERLGERAYGFIYDWMKNFHQPSTDPSSLVRLLSGMTSVAVLGFRIAQGLVQLSGLVQAYQTLPVGSKGCFFTALRENISNWSKWSTKAASERSEYMASRYADPITALFGAHHVGIKDVYQKFGMAPIIIVDRFVSTCTWDAAYKAALNQGKDVVEAKMLADSAVRISQTDSLTLSRSHAMRSDWARLVTPFSTYIMGMQSEFRGRMVANEKRRAIYWLLAYVVMVPFFESFLKEISEGADDADDKEFLERVSRRWYNNYLEAMGSTMYPILGAGDFAVKAVASGVETATTGDTLVESYWMRNKSIAGANQGAKAIKSVYYGISALGGDEDAANKAAENAVGSFSVEAERRLKKLLEG